MLVNFAVLGITVTAMEVCSPIFKLKLLGTEIAVAIGPTVLSSVTFTAQVAEMLLPSVEVAIIYAVPVFIAVTRPLALTVATDVLLDFQDNVLFVAFSGNIVVIN